MRPLLFTALLLALGVSGHIRLAFPPSYSLNDFLDNSRTPTPCGVNSLGVLTQLYSGTTVELSLRSSYAHRGGYVFTLRYPNGESQQVASITDVTASTANWAIPSNLTCGNCTLQLEGRALEWGANFIFQSCSDVVISVPPTATSCAANCYGRGNCTLNTTAALPLQCSCEPGYLGMYCENTVECMSNSDCQGDSICNVNRCYCKSGMFGAKCDQASTIDLTPATLVSKYRKTMAANGEMTLYDRQGGNGTWIEMVLVAPTANYAAVGWRPGTVTGHAMDGNDMVIGMAEGNYVRVDDYYTPSRATPIADVRRGGSDNLLDWNGYQNATTTVIAFRRALTTSDTTYDHPLVDNTRVIWAHGQDKPYAATIPSTGTDANYYRPDVLLYHGPVARGSFGLMNFQTWSLPTPSPSGSSLASFYSINSEATLHWTVNSQATTPNIEFALEVKNNGYVALGFPTTAGAMIGSYAIIGTSTGVKEYRLNEKDSNGILELTPPQIMDASYTLTDGVAVVRFKLPMNTNRTTISTTSATNFVWSRGGATLGYHEARGGFSVSLAATSAAPTPAPTPAAPATPAPVAAPSTSSLGYESSFAVNDKYTLHWTLESSADTPFVDIAVEATNTGYLAVAIPADPGSMVGASAVIGWPGAIREYKLTGKTVGAITPLSPAEIYDTMFEQIDGKSVMRFKRALVPADSSRGEFSASGDTPLLWSLGSGNALAQHTERGDFTVDLALGGAGAATSGNGDARAAARVAHGIMMFIAWGVSAPLAIISARFFKHKGPVWFKFHLGLQLVNMLLSFTAFGVALWMVNNAHFLTFHHFFGLVLMGGAVIQVVIAIPRPKATPMTPARKAWANLHRGFGIFLALFAIATIFLGMAAIQAHVAIFVLYGIWLLAVVSFVVYRTINPVKTPVDNADASHGFDMVAVAPPADEDTDNNDTRVVEEEEEEEAEAEEAEVGGAAPPEKVESKPDTEGEQEADPSGVVLEEAK